ncbi:NADP-dependent oxidoreductase [Shimazuella sp. AN120528]|uniref:NADP-dependent oxidoreductase n=1 Tax=Shimazuella soli TaxID=1892854 RepID=UPI001F0EE155|nr:NADP-dependent oxidoreductase [Shimazuella soli]MCH5583735.1 NADP-dependent oxidoreductase [Shimazuella soli]
MKAIQIHQYGDVDTLNFEEVPKPAPDSEEVLIRVHAAGVNPADFRGRQGLAKSIWDSNPFPIILGYDISGEIVEIGKGVSDFKIGDEVYGMIRFPYIGGGYAEFTTAPVSQIALKPSSMDHLQTAALPMPALTAWQALFDKGNLQSGQTILIHGASGGVGHIAVQLAKWKGAHVIGTASANNVEFLRKLGVDTIIDYTSQSLEAVVGDNEVDLVLYGIPTTSADISLEPSVRVLKPQGTFVSIVKNLESELNSKLAIEKEIKSYFFSVQPNASQLIEIAKIVDLGMLTTQIQTVLPLQQVRQAHQLLETGHVRGKIVLQIDKS